MNVINLHEDTPAAPFHEARIFSLSQAIQANASHIFTAVLGNATTSMQLWFDAKASFPSLPCWLLLANGQWAQFQWQCSPSAVADSSGLTGSVPEANLAPGANIVTSQQAYIIATESIEPEQSVTSENADQEAANTTLVPLQSKEKQTDQRVFEVFLKFSWGESEKHEANRFYEHQLHWVTTLDGPETGLIARFEHARKEGLQAAALIKTMQEKMPQHDTSEVNAWIKSLRADYSRRVVKALEKKLQKEQEWSNKNKAIWQQQKSFKVSLPNVYKGVGPHPHNIRQLKPAKSWRIFIDEGGEQFGIEAETLLSTDRELGRAVALLIPDYAELPPLSSKHHATEDEYLVLQALLSDLIKQPIGVFGAMVNNDLLSGSWLGSIEQLIRWTLLMLPFDGPTNVTVLIEQRGVYKAGEADLSALADVLESQLAVMMPERFAGLRLQLDFMAKDHNFNGYVDAVAHLWTTTDKIKQKMLQHIGWRHHCFLQDTKMPAAERLYRQLVQGEMPEPAVWLDACISAGSESTHSLLQDVLGKLGHKINSQPQLLEQYLRQVHLRISQQDVPLKDLATLLQWLQTQLPAGQTLPTALALSLQSALLVESNHKGLFNAGQISELQRMAEQYAAENVQAVCHLIIRLAISFTNCYAFNDARLLLSPWLMRSIETVGLLNRGKLLSAEGQMLAFQGQFDLALTHFDDAISTFERLSDDSERQRQIRQSRNYRSVVMLASDDPHAIHEIVSMLKQQYGDDQCVAIKRLARSGQPQQYLHYLVIRALVQFPVLDELCQIYLQEQTHWDFENNHPWMLIQAYRGWLLCMDNQPEIAFDYFHSAITLCSEQQSSPVIAWMGQCLAALASSLDLPICGLVLKQPLPAGFPVSQLEFLARASSQKERLSALENLLPFNFH
jgi:hypothetical protein